MITFASLDRVRTQLKLDEGFRAHPYPDTAGKTTIGYGRNLTDDGITEAEASVLLEHDLAGALTAVTRACPWSATLDDVRLGVLLQLEVNLGLAGELKFVQMLAALERGDYDAASGALIDSVADQQEPARVMRWAQELKTGVQI